MAKNNFPRIDIEAAIEATAKAQAITMSDEDVSDCASAIEADMYIGTSNVDIVTAFRRAIDGFACSDARIVNAMAAQFPAELINARHTRAKEVETQAEKAESKARAEERAQEKAQLISDVAERIDDRLSSVNTILSDARKKVPTIKGEAAKAGTGNSDLDTQLATIESAAMELLKCQNDIARANSKKAAEDADEASGIHFRDAKAAENAIAGIQTQVKSGVAVSQVAAKQKKTATKKKGKAKKSQLRQFLSTPLGYVSAIGLFVGAIVFALVFYPTAVQVAVIVAAFVVVILAAFSLMREQTKRVPYILGGFAVTVFALLLLLSSLSFVGKGWGSDRDILSLNKETPTPTIVAPESKDFEPVPTKVPMTPTETPES